jgi:hypothetical protein
LRLPNQRRCRDDLQLVVASLFATTLLLGLIIGAGVVAFAGPTLRKQFATATLVPAAAAAGEMQNARCAIFYLLPHTALRGEHRLGQRLPRATRSLPMPPQILT